MFFAVSNNNSSLNSSNLSLQSVFGTPIKSLWNDLYSQHRELLVSERVLCVMKNIMLQTFYPFDFFYFSMKRNELKFHRMSQKRTPTHDCIYVYRTKFVS